VTVTEVVAGPESLNLNVFELTTVLADVETELNEKPVAADAVAAPLPIATDETATASAALRMIFDTLCPLPGIAWLMATTRVADRRESTRVVDRKR
jgi:hypothetical protein